MQKEQIKTFLELVELDQRIAQQEKELAEGAEKIAQIDTDLEQISDEVKLAEKVAHDIQKAVDSLELELKVIDQQQGRIREKLLMASSQKELDSLALEQTALTKKRIELDEQGLVFLLDLEKAQKDAAQKKADQPEKERAKQEEKKDLQERLDHVQKLHDTYEKERGDIAAPEDLAQKYEGMRKQVPNPVVPIIKDGCSGCFHGLSRPEIIKAQQGELLTCQGCYRMLYITQVEKDDE